MRGCVLEVDESEKKCQVLLVDYGYGARVDCDQVFPLPTFVKDIPHQVGVPSNCYMYYYNTTILLFNGTFDTYYVLIQIFLLLPYQVIPQITKHNRYQAQVDGRTVLIRKMKLFPKIHVMS